VAGEVGKALGQDFSPEIFHQKSRALVYWDCWATAYLVLDFSGERGGVENRILCRGGRCSRQGFGTGFFTRDLSPRKQSLSSLGLLGHGLLGPGFFW
jgi:hypothetical protein